MQGWWCFQAGKVDVKKKPKLPKATQKLEVSWSHFLVEDAMWPMYLKQIWNSKWEISPSLADVCVCDQLQLFAEMKYLASRQLWNLQTLKTPDTSSWVVPSPRFKFRNPNLRCTIHRNKHRLEYINSIRIHVKSSHSFSSLKSVENHRKVTVWTCAEKCRRGPTAFLKWAVSHL